MPLADIAPRFSADSQEKAWRETRWVRLFVRVMALIVSSASLVLFVWAFSPRVGWP